MSVTKHFSSELCYSLFCQWNIQSVFISITVTYAFVWVCEESLRTKIVEKWRMDGILIIVWWQMRRDRRRRERRWGKKEVERTWFIMRCKNGKGEISMTKKRMERDKWKASEFTMKLWRQWKSIVWSLEVTPTYWLGQRAEWGQTNNLFP